MTTKPLTPAQRAVLAYAASGYSTKETAKRLGISNDTVRTHRQAAIRRLQARNITQAVYLWLTMTEEGVKG
jgi:DNA-binding CsgD family transcriptional regulator